MGRGDGEAARDRTARSLGRDLFVSLRDGGELRFVPPPTGLRFTEGRAFSPDGTKLFVGVEDARSGVVAVEMASGTVVGTLAHLHRGEHAATHWLTVSADGERLLEGNLDQSVLLLDATFSGGRRAP